MIPGSDSSDIDRFKLEMKSLFQMSGLELLPRHRGSIRTHGIDILPGAYAQKLLEKGGLARSNL